MSAVQYDQVKIVIKQMANFQPILHVHYYYQGKLVQTKFTVEKNQIQKFIRTTIDEANLKKVEIEADKVKLNYRDFGSIEINDYSMLKSESLFREFDENIVQRKLKKEEKRKIPSGVKNLKVNHKYNFWTKVKKKVTQVGATVLIGASLVGGLSALERLVPFHQNKSKIETEGTNETTDLTDIEHSTITLAQQEEGQKVKVLFSKQNSGSETVEEATKQNQNIVPSSTDNIEVTPENSQVPETTQEEANQVVDETNTQFINQTNQQNEAEKSTNWFSTQLESAKNVMSEAIGLMPKVEKKEDNSNTTSVNENTKTKAEDLATSSEFSSVETSNQFSTQTQEEKAANQITESSAVAETQVEVTSVQDETVSNNANIAVERELNKKEEKAALNLSDQSEKVVANETSKENSTPTKENQEAPLVSESPSLNEKENTSHLVAATSTTSKDQGEVSQSSDESTSLASEQSTTTSSENTKEKESISEETETASSPSTTIEENKVDQTSAVESKIDQTSTASLNNQTNTVTTTNTSTSSQNQDATITTNRIAETVQDAITTMNDVNQVISENTVNEVSLHQEIPTSTNSSEGKDKLASSTSSAGTSELTTSTEDSVTPTTIAYQEQVTVDDHNTIKSGYHYTTGNTTYPMSEEDFYKLVVIINAESNKTYEDALGVASVIANRIEDGGWGGSMPLEIATAQGQFAVWQNSSVRSAASTAASTQSFDNAEVVKAARDCFFGGIRNNDYVEFKSSGSSTYSSSGEKKYQIVSGGNKYHHLATNLNRVTQNQYSSISPSSDLNSIYDTYKLDEEENNRSLSA